MRTTRLGRSRQPDLTGAPGHWTSIAAAIVDAILTNGVIDCEVEDLAEDDKLDAECELKRREGLEPQGRGRYGSRRVAFRFPVRESYGGSAGLPPQGKEGGNLNHFVDTEGCNDEV